ncbi:MAG: ankyrin repeat domain-containing protein [Paracoccaceae bacterium]|nr:ankyrin repeat domain-containing protein [Paracoccaceae bacterium]
MPRLFVVLALLFTLVNAAPATAQPSELMTAARGGDLEKVTALLDSGAEPDPQGIATPLYFAAQGGHLEIAKILLESGANANAQSNWGTPLHISARRGHLEIAKVLLQHGANPNLMGGEHDSTPLHEAAEKGAVEIGALLIDRGADVNARNSQFQPPIHLAAKRNRSEFAELLRKHGAAAIEVEPISGDLAAADIEKGRIRALECGVCHQMVKVENTGGDGPRLWGIVGRPIASLDYPYSDAMSSQSGSWTFERLNAFLADPMGIVPGTVMNKGYVDDRAERVALIAYLRTLSDDPVPLP